MMKTGQTPVSNHEIHYSLGPDGVSLIETRKMLTRNPSVLLTAESFKKTPGIL